MLEVTLCAFKSTYLGAFLGLEKSSHHYDRRKIIVEIDCAGLEAVKSLYAAEIVCQSQRKKKCVINY